MGRRKNKTASTGGEGETTPSSSEAVTEPKSTTGEATPKAESSSKGKGKGIWEWVNFSTVRFLSRRPLPSKAGLHPSLGLFVFITASR